MDAWKKKGSLTVPSEGSFEETGIVPWDIWKEWETHDIRRDARKLTMPILFVVGANDNITPAKDVQAFVNALPNGHQKNQLIIIEGADHRFQNSNGIVLESQLSQHVGTFIDTLDL